MRKKHVPMRTCVGCRETRPKRDLVRVVREPDGKVGLDLTGKRSGRGVYICAREECLEKARKGRQLERSLEVSVGEDVFADLKRVLHEQSL
ncbi:MAG: YlxR family protein [Bacillota bacterium]|nr:YlxR family protein [Bacillota bacterium]NLJ03267.1 YlxR family protein [Bacillota bacterium]